MLMRPWPPLVGAHGKSRTAIEHLQAAVRKAVATTRGELAAIHDGDDASRWRKAVEQSAQEYKAVVAQLAAAGIAKAARKPKQSATTPRLCFRAVSRCRWSAGPAAACT